jgi:hypothetical protein
MDTTALVKDMIEDGKRIIEQLTHDGFEVTTAFWLKKADNSRWYFYVVSPLWEKEGSFVGYQQLHTSIRRLGPEWIDPSEVRLIGPTNPIARDVLAAHRRTAGTKASPTWWGGTHLGNVTVEDAYLYPLPAVASS